MPKQSLGEFEQLVLLACLRLDQEAYAVSIIKEIEVRTRRKASHAAVYVALRRLEDKGLVSSWLADPTPQRGGRSKRFFHVQPDAVALLKDHRNAFINMWDGLTAMTR